jgi:uracil-DNA glycosylase
MEKCFSNFEWELENLKPTTVFLLGKQVATFIMKRFANEKPMLDDAFHYTRFNFRNIRFIPIHHPSYILVYKRKILDEYIKQVQIHFPSPMGAARINNANSGLAVAEATV